jgi:hypothetical protein
MALGLTILGAIALGLTVDELIGAFGEDAVDAALGNAKDTALDEDPEALQRLQKMFDGTGVKVAGGAGVLKSIKDVADARDGKGGKTLSMLDNVFKQARDGKLTDEALEKIIKDNALPEELAQNMREAKGHIDEALIRKAELKSVKGARPAPTNVDDEALKTFKEFKKLAVDDASQISEVADNKFNTMAKQMAAQAQDVDSTSPAYRKLVQEGDDVLKAGRAGLGKGKKIIADVTDVAHDLAKQPVRNTAKAGLGLFSKGASKLGPAAKSLKNIPGGRYILGAGVLGAGALSLMNQEELTPEEIAAREALRRGGSAVIAEPEDDAFGDMSIEELQQQLQALEDPAVKAEREAEKRRQDRMDKIFESIGQ